MDFCNLVKRKMNKTSIKIIVLASKREREATMTHQRSPNIYQLSPSLLPSSAK